MSRGRKSTTNFKGADWETVFYNSVGFFVQMINKELSKVYRLEPLSNHIKIIGGFAFKNSEYKKTGVPIIRISDFSNEKITINDVVYYEESDKLANYELVENDIVIALTGGTIGKLAIVQEGLGKLYLNQRVGKFKVLNPEEFESEYVYWIARSVQSIIKNLAWGAAIPNVSSKQIEALQFPLPQKSVQKGIIEFLNDLKNNCLDEGKIYFDKGIEAKIFALQISQIDCNLISRELNHQVDLVKQLRQSFLREAMQGKLTCIRAGSEENQETGQQLLEKIKAEKAQLIKDKKLKKEKEIPRIKPEEIPFEIPADWVWCRLGEVAEIGTGATPLTSNPEYYSEGNIAFVTSAATGSLFVDEAEFYITQKALIETNCKVYPIGTLIVAMYGQGKTRGQITELNIEAATNQACATISLFLKNQVINRYVKLYFQKIYLEIRELAQGGAQPNLNMGKIRDTIIPIPPLFEQDLIVERLENSFHICNQLENSIKQSQQQNELLLQQVLREALEVGTKDEQMKEVKIIKLPVLQHVEDFYYHKRKALATYIINHSLSDPWLGDTKLMKLLHLSDYHAIKRNLGQKFYQKAAGPFDNGFIYPFFKEIENDGWFKRIKKDGRFYFSTGINHNLSLQTDTYFSQEELSSVDQVIAYFKKDNYERPEIISTLYAVWNNRIIKGDPISDELIKQDFLDWDSQKIKYEFRLNNELKWMKDQGIIPNGWGRVIGKPRS